jgi:hypothetical protein
MRYCKISKEMLSLYFGFAEFCRPEARVLEFDTQPLPSEAVESVHTQRQIRDFELSEYIKPKIQQRSLFASLTRSHL